MKKNIILFGIGVAAGYYFADKLAGYPGFKQIVGVVAK